MRLLVVTPEYPPHAGGGILKYYSLLAEAWTKAGVEVTVLVSSPYSSFDGYDQHGVAVRFASLENVRRHAERLSHLVAVPQFRQWLAAGLAAADWLNHQGHHFDVVETTDFGLLFAPLVALEQRPPILVRMHGSLGQISEHEPIPAAAQLDYALARVTEQSCLPGAEGLSTYSPANASEWRTRLGVDVGFIPPPLVLRPAREADDLAAFTGLAVGRIQPWKGPEVLCQALRRLNSVPHARALRIAWVGRDTNAGPQGQSTSAWLSQAYPDVWGPRIVPVGPRTAEQVACLQASARMCLVPSLWDTFNFTLAESMGHGALTVGSEGAGASYLIEHGVSGLVFARNAAEQLTEVLDAAMRMPDAERTAIGRAGQEVVRRELDPDRVAVTCLQEFSSVMSRPRSVRPGEWLRGFISEGKPSDRFAHLNNVGLRDLVSHLGERLARKVRAR